MLSNQAHLFNIDEGKTYINCAYMSPMLKAVEEAGIEGMRVKRHPWKLTAETFFNPAVQVGQEFAKLIGSDAPERVVLTPSASYGIATVARNLKLKAGDNIVGVSEQFPSNVYSWKRAADEHNATLRMIEAPATTENVGTAWTQAILDAIDANTKLVSMPHVHWADGTLYDLKTIGQRAKEVGAWFVIDGTQSIGALPFDVQAFQVDAVICASYKWLMGSYSSGIAWFGPAFDGGVPIEENWITRKDSDQFAGLVEYKDDYRPGAFRYNMGEMSNFTMVPMLLEALKQVNAWTPEGIQEYCASISANALNRLEAAGFRIPPADQRGAHLFGIRAPEGTNPADLKARLDAANILVSMRGDAVRVAPHTYNTAADMELLADALIG